MLFPELNIRHETADAAASLQFGWRDVLALCSVVVLTLIVFGSESSRLGFYSDDAGFLSSFRELSFHKMLDGARTYVTGRNLHIVWQYIIYVFAGNSIDSLGNHHWIQASSTALNVGLMFVLLRMIRISTLAAFLASALFAFYPNHAEVQYWLSSLPMNLISTTFVFLLFLSGIITVRAARNGHCLRASVLLILDFVFYSCALFTYDQTVPLVVVGAIVIGLVCLLNPGVRIAAVSFLVAAVGLFLFLVQWKIREPAGGPVLSNVNLPHMFSAFVQSLSEMFGRTLVRSVSHLVANAALAELLVAGVCGIIVLGVAIAISWAPAFERSMFRPEVPSRWWSLLDRLFEWGQWFSPVMLFLLAYLPVYIWYISPRHNYLPSIAMALGVAMLFDLFLGRTWISKDNRGALFLSAFVACAVFVSVSADLVEKRAWIQSYEARERLYAELELAPGFRAANTLIFDGFPTSTPVGSAPLGYQQATEVGLITRGRKEIANLVRDSQSSRLGEYVYIGLDEFGADAFRYATSEEIYHIRFLSIEGNVIKFDEVKPKLGTGLFSVEILDSNSEHRASNEFYIRRKDDYTIAITIPALHLLTDEIVTLVPLVTGEGKIGPMTVRNAFNARNQVLIDGPENMASPHVIILKTTAVLPQLVGFRLYVTHRWAGARLLDEKLLTQ